MAGAENRLELLHSIMRERRCECGNNKKQREAFCNRCLQVLGANAIRGDRYKLGGTVDDSMVEAYLACLEFLIGQAYIDGDVRTKWERLA